MIVYLFNDDRLVYIFLSGVIKKSEATTTTTKSNIDFDREKIGFFFLLVICQRFDTS